MKVRRAESVSWSMKPRFLRVARTMKWSYLVKRDSIGCVKKDTRAPKFSKPNYKPNKIIADTKRVPPKDPCDSISFRNDTN
jgi:hypothetical protein